MIIKKILPISLIIFSYFSTLLLANLLPQINAQYVTQFNYNMHMTLDENYYNDNIGNLTSHDMAYKHIATDSNASSYDYNWNYEQTEN